MAREKNTLVAFRLTEERAREFKAQCVLRGTSIQAVLEQAVNSFMDLVNNKAD